MHKGDHPGTGRREQTVSDPPCFDWGHQFLFSFGHLQCFNALHPVAELKKIEQLADSD